MTRNKKLKGNSLFKCHDRFRWRPVLGIEEILLSVISMINEPNINSPANVDAAVD